MRRFISRPIAQQGDVFLTPSANGEPPLPSTFTWDEGTIVIHSVVRTWRSTKTDRGDAYLKRFWFEVELAGGGRAEIYFDREARRGQPHWWLYTVDNV